MAKERSRSKNQNKSRNQNTPPRQGVKSSLVARLNTRLFFRLVGIYAVMNLILTVLFITGLFVWADGQCADISALVERRGIPSAEASEWMQAGDYTVQAGSYDGVGFPLPQLRADFVGEHGGKRYLDPGNTDLFFLLHFSTGNPAGYAVECSNALGDNYTICLDLSGPLSMFGLASRVLLVCQLISLISNLLKNAGTIKKVLRPIQELTAATMKLGNSKMSPEELRDLAGRLDAINAASLNERIPVEGAQKELKNLTHSINAMLDRIDQAYRSQARFVSDASHELRTPIAVIQGYANLLDRWGKDDPDAMQESISAIRAEAESMKELVEQLLFLARGDNDSVHVEPEIFDLTGLSGRVLAETQMLDEVHPLSAGWQDHVYVNADIGLVKQAMRILIDNALKYTPAGGHITVSVRQEEHMARFSVTDEGQGIAPESIPHIFDRFYRTDESRARQTGGAGLGLSIAQWIAVRHGGWCEVISRQNVGTRITFVLPAAEVPLS